MLCLYFFFMLQRTTRCICDYSCAFDRELPHLPPFLKNLFCFAERHVAPYGVDLDIFFQKDYLHLGRQAEWQFPSIQEVQGIPFLHTAWRKHKTPDHLQHLLSLI